MRVRVGQQQAGMRAETVVRACTGVSRAEVRRLFAQGAVRLSGRPVAKGERMLAGQCLEIAADSGVLQMAASADPEVAVQVRYEDQALLVVEKLAGMPSHPLRAGERGCLANGLLARYPELAGVGYEARQPGLVNRLDNGTSGLLLVARTGDVFDALRASLVAGQIDKSYLCGCFSVPPLGWIARALRSDPRRSPRVEAALGPCDPAQGWRAARTQVVRVSSLGKGQVVEVRAHRARRHQVRAHLASVGSPLAGDVLYGGAPLACGHQLLHASRLAFAHPVHGRPVLVESARPQAWEEHLRTESTAPPDP